MVDTSFYYTVKFINTTCSSNKDNLIVQNEIPFASYLIIYSTKWSINIMISLLLVVVVLYIRTKLLNYTLKEHKN